MIYNAGEIIYLDDVQYNRRSWQNRFHIRDNNLQSKKKLISLSVIDYHREKKICEYKIAKENIDYLKNNLWQSYKETKYYSEISDLIIESFKMHIEKNLSIINIELINLILKYLNINYVFSLSSEFKIKEKKERLILGLLNSVGANCYLANNGSLNYAGEDLFLSKGFKFKLHNYKHPTYSQYNRKKKLVFLPLLSVVDLLFNYQRDSEEIVKSFKLNFN
jgi:hypothetical protein